MYDFHTSTSNSSKTAQPEFIAMPRPKKRRLSLRQNAEAARAKRWQNEDSSSDSDTAPDEDFSPEEVDFMDVFRDWASSLDKWNGKMLSTYLCFLLQKACPKKVTTISATVADLLSISERTVRSWKQTFVQNDGDFPDTEAAVRRHAAFRDDEELCEKARDWVRSHTHVKGQPNMRSIDI